MQNSKHAKKLENLMKKLSDTEGKSLISTISIFFRATFLSARLSRFCFWIMWELHFLDDFCFYRISQLVRERLRILIRFFQKFQSSDTLEKSSPMKQRPWTLDMRSIRTSSVCIKTTTRTLKVTMSCVGRRRMATTKQWKLPKRRTRDEGAKHDPFREQTT